MGGGSCIHRALHRDRGPSAQGYEERHHPIATAKTLEDHGPDAEQAGATAVDPLTPRAHLDGPARRQRDSGSDRLRERVPP